MRNALKTEMTETYDKNNRGKKKRGTPLRPHGSFRWKMASVLKRDISMNAPVLRGDFTQNVPQLLAIPADPSGEMEELMAWYPYTQILAYWACGISINRVLYQTGTTACSSLLLLASFPSLLTLKVNFFFSFCWFFSNSGLILLLTVSFHNTDLYTFFLLFNTCSVLSI